MKRILGHVASMLVAALAISAAMPACTDNDQSVFIRSALAPSANRQNGACLYTDDPQQPILLEATLDVGVRDDYSGIFLVGNQMIPRGDPNNARAESNRIHIDGGIVRVTRTDGTLIREFTAYATGFADPQNNNSPDYGIMGLVALDAPTAAVLRAELPNSSASIQVLSNIRVFGKTLAGKDVESAEYQLPIRVCNGCLVFFPDGVNDTTQPPERQPNCFLAPSAGATQGQILPCARGQDEGLSCRSCLGRPACDVKRR